MSLKFLAGDEERPRKKDLKLWVGIKDAPVMEINRDVELAKPCASTSEKLRKMTSERLAKRYVKTMKENQPLYADFRRNLSHDFPVYQMWDNNIREFMLATEKHTEKFLRSADVHTAKERKAYFLRMTEIAEGIKECLNAAIDDIGKEITKKEKRESRKTLGQMLK